MNKIDYNNRKFASIENSKAGEVSAETIFHYRQKGEAIWATYQGGEILCGTLTARILSDGKLDMRYSHININSELMTGICESTPETLPDGRIRLYEKWQWTCGDFSKGESIIEEIR